MYLDDNEESFLRIKHRPYDGVKSILSSGGNHLGKHFEGDGDHNIYHESARTLLTPLSLKIEEMKPTHHTVISR